MMAAPVTAVVAANRTKPAPLILPSDGDDRNSPHLRRPSSSSVSSNDSLNSPGLSALDSSSALILVHDQEDPDTPFEFSEDEDDEDDDIVSPLFEIRRSTIPPLPPSTVFLYLLAPFLKLGTLNILNAQLPLKYGLPSLLVFAALSAFARQVWYMLARYLRKADLTDIFCDTFAKARGKERQRDALRALIKAGTGIVGGLLAVAYLRESIHILLPLLPLNFDPFLLRFFIILMFGFILFILSTSRSLSSRRIIYSTWLSILTYAAWLSCIIYAHATGTLAAERGWFGNRSFWQGIFITGFAFCSSSTLPLYASLKSNTNPLSTNKAPRSHSFRLLSILSVVCGILLILPLVIFAAFPNTPVTSQIRPSAVEISLAILSSATLFLGVPQIIVTIPPFCMPERIARTATFNVSRALTTLFVILLSLVPPNIFRFLSESLCVLSLASTYFLPTFMHISTHFFKRPVAIVIPRTPLLQTPTNGGGSQTSNARAMHDELLQRKERALQLKQFKKRIVWDIGVWIMFGLSIAGFVVGIITFVR